MSQDLFSKVLEKETARLHKHLQCAGLTHYAGCPCHEAAWQKRVDDLETEIRDLKVQLEKANPRKASTGLNIADLIVRENKDYKTGTVKSISYWKPQEGLTPEKLVGGLFGLQSNTRWEAYIVRYGHMQYTGTFQYRSTAARYLEEMLLTQGW